MNSTCHCCKSFITCFSSLLSCSLSSSPSFSTSPRISPFAAYAFLNTISRPMTAQALKMLFVPTLPTYTLEICLSLHQELNSTLVQVILIGKWRFWGKKCQIVWRNPIFLLWHSLISRNICGYQRNSISYLQKTS